jgi:amino-acid N-acetyltransferase
MNTTYQPLISKPNDEQRIEILSLLKAEKLPFEDLSNSLGNFLVAIEDNKVIGAIGLEQYENYGLLRSMVVSKKFRNQKIASSLVHHLEGLASAQGIECIYLLTETASEYFEKKGYQKISREKVPASIQASSEFSHICPASAIVMKKSFAASQ